MLLPFLKSVIKSLLTNGGCCLLSRSKNSCTHASAAKSEEKRKVRGSRDFSAPLKIRGHMRAGAKKVFTANDGRNFVMAAELCIYYIGGPLCDV